MNALKMMRSQTRTRGFTLVELIVVIAIVAILAAVSIVGYQGYIDKARMSNDVTDAKNMTNVLKSYLITNDVPDLSANDIRSIVNIDNDYSFVPRTEGSSFWYDEETETISVRSDYDGFVQELTLLKRGQTELLSDAPNQGKTLGNDGTTNPGDGLEEVINGYFLLDVSGSLVAEAINTIRNLKSAESYDDVYLSLSENALLQGHLDGFSLSTTLFINDFFGMTEYVFDPLAPQAVNVIFADGLEALPSDALAGLDGNTNPLIFPESLRLPVSISIVQSGALERLAPTTRVVYQGSLSIRFETGAMNPLTTTNQDILALERAIDMYEIGFRTNYTRPKTSFYSPIDGSGLQTYLGKTVTEDIQSPEMVDEHFLKLYPLNGYAYGDTPNLASYDSEDPLHAGSFRLIHEISDPLSAPLGTAEELAMTNIYWPSANQTVQSLVGTQNGYQTLDYNGTTHVFGNMGWTLGATPMITNWDQNPYRIYNTTGTFIGTMVKNNIEIDETGTLTSYHGYVFYDTSGQIIDLGSVATSAFAAFDTDETVFSTRMYDISMKNGDDFTFPTSDQSIYYVNSSGHMTLLTIPMVVTNAIYDQANQLIGTYEETKLDYVKNSWNWHYGTAKNMLFISTYGWQGHATVFSGGNISAAADQNGDPLDHLTFETLPSYQFAFSDTPSVTIFQSNVQIYLKENLDVIIYGLHVTYRTVDGVVVVEAKGYDAQGRLFAKGSMSYVDTVVGTNTLSLS